MNNLIQQPQGRGSASSSEVLNGKTFTNDNGEQTGTMVDRNQSSITYTSSNSTPVQVADAWFCDTNSDGVKRLCFRTNGIAGYYGGNVLVSRPLTDFGTATAGQVESGASFTSTSGVAISGTRPNYGYEPTASSMNLWQGNVYFYLPNETSQGHYATIGRSLKYPAWRFGACEAVNVISGCTFSSSNGLSQTGTLTNHGAWGATISPGGSVTIPWGYHNGGGVVLLFLQSLFRRLFYFRKE